MRLGRCAFVDNEVAAGWRARIVSGEPGRGVDRQPDADERIAYRTSFPFAPRFAVNCQQDELPGRSVVGVQQCHSEP